MKHCLYLNRDLGGLLKQGTRVRVLSQAPAILAGERPADPPRAYGMAAICTLADRGPSDLVVLDPAFLTFTRPEGIDAGPTLCQAARAERREAGIRRLSARTPDDAALAESALAQAYEDTFGIPADAALAPDDAERNFALVDGGPYGCGLAVDPRGDVTDRDEDNEMDDAELAARASGATGFARSHTPTAHGPEVVARACVGR
jgi:hypothetical protein